MAALEREDPGNRAAQQFTKEFNKEQVEFVVNVEGTTRDDTKITLDDAETTLGDLVVGDAVVVQSKAPKGATSFTARSISAQKPEPVPYYQDTDGDGVGTGESTEYAPNRVPEGYADKGGDNCPDVANPDQADSDGDGTGDACEAASDEAAPEATT